MAAVRRLRLRAGVSPRSAAASETSVPERRPGSRKARPRPTFVLGTGAQKAGTTWLSNYLNSSPHYDSGYRKEYHLFDALDLPSEAWITRRMVTRATTALEAIRNGEQADPRALHTAAMYADPELYFDYFAGLAQRRGPVRATGDLTPDYAMLSAERMRDIAARFDRRGLRTVAVFLMRDPVERIYSHIRMKTHRKPERFPEGSDAELLHRHGDNPYWLRTQYHQTLDALQAAFTPEQVHIGLFENLFHDDSQSRAVASLVRLPFREPRLDTPRNSSPRADDGLPEDVARLVAEHYADTYRGVAERMPQLDIARWWPHARHVL